jgi:hypothetical protein
MLAPCQPDDGLPLMNRHASSRNISELNPEQHSQDDNTDDTICAETDIDGVTAIKDHFTLSTPSSIIRFRANTSSAFRIYPSHNSQFIMESREDANGKHHVHMKRLADSTSNLRLLRLTYTLVAAFFSGFVLVFCLKIMLILLTEFTVAAGFTGYQRLDTFESVGILLSFPVFIYAMAAGLVISGRKYTGLVRSMHRRSCS